MNTYDSIVEAFETQFELTHEDAAHCADVYLKDNAIKIDHVTGSWSLVHGALWERNIVERALTMDRT